MTTLTQASIGSRKIIRYSIYLIIFLIIGRIVLIAGIGIYKKIFPPAPTPATVSFGRLSKLPFPEKQKFALNFTVETPEGGIPNFPPQSKVFFMPKISSNLLSLDFAKEKAEKLNFNPDPQKITQSIYKFYHKFAPAVLETDIITGAFSISYDLKIDPTPLSVRPNQPEVSASTIRSFLSNAGLLPSDLTGPIEYQYLKTKDGVFVPALSLSDANIIRINLFRKSYDNLPIISNTFKESNIWFLVSGLRERGKDVIAGEYHYFPVDESQSATYPIKTGDTAWQEFSSGNYYPESLGATVENENIKIRKIYLAYYDPGVYTEFLQPVFVFEGDKNFVGLVPAITPDYYGE
jgi:hypothetical protein